MSAPPPPRPLAGPPPPPWAPFPAPARRPRPSAWWFVVGGALLVLAAVSGVALLVWTLLGFTETDTALPVDGETHAVTVDADRDRMLWYDETHVRPDCTVADAATGKAIALRAPGATLTRGEGSLSWRALHRFDPGSGELEVTCAASGGSPGRADVEIGPAPRIATMVGGIVAGVLVPVVLGGIGLLVLVVTAVRFATGDPRPSRD